jgi:hypothetical protein
LCQDYTLTLNQLYNLYRNKGIQLVGVFSDMTYDRETLLQFQRKYQIQFMLAKDKGGSLLALLRPTVTPEAILVGNKGEILYQGRIDNWAYRIGSRRTIITENNLKDAIEAILHHRPIAIKKTKAIGCYIEH